MHYLKTRQKCLKEGPVLWPHPPFLVKFGTQIFLNVFCLGTALKDSYYIKIRVTCADSLIRSILWADCWCTPNFSLKFLKDDRVAPSGFINLDNSKIHNSHKTTMHLKIPRLSKKIGIWQTKYYTTCDGIPEYHRKCNDFFILPKVSTLFAELTYNMPILFSNPSNLA